MGALDTGLAGEAGEDGLCEGFVSGVSEGGHGLSLMFQRSLSVFIAISLGLTKTKINIRDLPLSGKWQSDLIQLEHRTPGVGVENGIRHVD